MYVVIYNFSVHSDLEDRFLEAWEQLTRLIYEYEGSLGSRIHRNLDDPKSYIAYAQWPSEEAWKSSGDRLPEAAEKWRNQMRTACAEITTLHRLEVGKDLLTTSQFTSA